MITNIGPLKTEPDKMDQKPPITTCRHHLLTILRKASLFTETSAMIFAAVKKGNCWLSFELQSLCVIRK